jgi:hypothetical protein
MHLSQMEAGLRAVTSPFPLDNPLVKYTALGLKKGRLDRALERVLKELESKRVPKETVRDVRRYVEEDALVQQALKVRNVLVCCHSHLLVAHPCGNLGEYAHAGIRG